MARSPTGSPGEARSDRRGPRRALADASVRAAALGSALLLPLLASARPAAGQEWTRVTSSRRDLGRVERLDLDVEFAAGRITVERAEPGYLYRQRLRYAASRLEFTRDWSRSDGVGRLRLGLEGRGGGGRWLRWDGLDVDFDLDGLRELEEESAVLDLALSPAVPAALNLRIGAASSDLRLGGVPLTSLRVETGASETRVSFDRPNPVRMERLELRAGAASLRATGLGNARFEELDLEGGVGEVRLDFRGGWERDARASLNVGLGSLELTFPEELGVRIRRRSFLSSFDAPAEFERTDDGYRSENWSSAEHRLTLDVSAAFGSVRIRVRD